MTILVTGGGSGGHITPILAVARELKKQHPDVRIVYVTHTGDPYDDIPAGDPNVDEIQYIRAGKFRRYHGEGIEQLFDYRTMWLNLRDALYILIGIWQSFWLLRKIRPAIIFTRGSFVSVPVCLSAALQRIPYVTHDSDAIPSLTNRIVSRWAAVHAVALPEELYPYPIDKTVMVGVPISPDYRYVDDDLRHKYKEELNLGGYEEVLLVTGGGLGSRAVNGAVIVNATHLLQRYPGMAIVHITGREHEAEVREAYKAALNPEAFSRVIVKGFVTDMYRYSGSANLVIARAGATNLAELAVQAKPSIIVPAPQLTGGHQLKNTAALKAQGAIIEMTEDQLEQEQRLTAVVSDLFDNPAKLQQLSRQFAGLARPDAAREIAAMLFQRSRNGAAEDQRQA
jgi:UDP-N-acetylglucosamine--N-acetylmuramyl-(pentapeptide) pyrophosphoryl-undecaprenol N-acetylglucosamine transferase